MDSFFLLLFFELGMKSAPTTFFIFKDFHCNTLAILLMDAHTQTYHYLTLFQKLDNGNFHTLILIQIHRFYIFDILCFCCETSILGRYKNWNVTKPFIRVFMFIKKLCTYKL